MTSVLITATVIAFSIMLVTWLVSVKLKDAAIIDVVWGIALLAVALGSFIVGSGDTSWKLFLLSLVAVWGLRISLHIGLRKRKEPEEDRRYKNLRHQHPHFIWWSLGWIFGLQALLVVLVSLPVQTGMNNPAPPPLQIMLGLGLFLVGFLFEAVSDWQLTRFKNDLENKDQVMNRGLWKYTRHPNYFGDSLVWWSLWVIVLDFNNWWTFLGPFILTLFLVKYSGAGLLEKDIGERRPEYQKYIETTPAFIPRIVKRT